VTRILLISGSTRAGSTNTAVLRTAPAVAPAGVATVLYQGMADLPAFNPDDDHDPLPPTVADLRGHLAEADAVLVCTPEYAGALPGAFKNLLDWTVGDPAVQGKPTGWVNVASVAAPTGGAGAHGELATVLGYLGADVVGAACVRAPMTRQDVGEDRLVSNPAVQAQLAAALRALSDHVAATRSSWGGSSALK
jgi:chromate reductase, NAD(P)H dehydrogenase (quinone)